MLRVVLNIVCFGVVHLSLGCAIRTPAAPQRSVMPPAVFNESIWPSRWSDDLGGAADQIPRTLYLYIPRLERDADGKLSAGGRTRHEPFWRILTCAPHGRGVVQEYQRCADDFPQGVELATFLEMLRQQREEESVQGIAARVRWLRFLQWVNEPSDDQLRSDDVNDWVRHGAGILLLPADEAPVGLAIVIGGGSKYDWELRRHLVERGWAVLHMGLGSTMDVNSRSEFTVAGFGNGLTLTAAELARTVDHYIADAVYAVEAFISYAREHD
jgi:hypothetical protein